MPCFRQLAALLLACSALSANLTAAEHWLRLRTPHFEMYTTNSEKQGTAALQVFEQVRYFFLENSHSKSAPDVSVRIIAFRSEKEYKPYRLNGGAFAYYLRSRKVDYIVMQDISPEHYQSAVHEYTHLIIEHLGLKPPLWLNEGLADLYSSLESRGNQAIVGRPIAGRVAVLFNQPWMSLPALLNVRPDSPYYNESNKMSIFYAESWALTHMVALGKGYQPRFSQFLTAMASGKSSADCFQEVYGKNLDQVTEDLHRYLKQSSVQAAIFNVKLPKAELEPEVTDASNVNVELALADLLASRPQTMAEAQDRLTKLAAENPADPDVEESLGYLAWQQNDKAKARECFRLAMEKGSKNPEMLFHYSQLLRESGAPPKEILPALQQAVALKPDYVDAWFDLGLTAMNAGQWGGALQALAHVQTVKPERAYTLFAALAYCDFQLKAFHESRVLAERAKQYAKDPDQNLQIARLLESLDYSEQKGTPPAAAALPAQPPPTDRPSIARNAPRELPRDVPSAQWSDDLRHVEAVAKSFDCHAGAPRLHVLVNGKEMVLALADPKAVVVRNAAGGRFDMHCGPQKPFHVGIFYIPTKTTPGLDGVIREMVF